MFIQLSQMLTQANLSGVHLMIRPLGEGKLSVMVATESDGFKADNPALKAALAQPLNVQGLATDLGEGFDTALQQFIDTYCETHSTSNVDDVSQGHVQAASGANKNTIEADTTSETKGETNAVTQEYSPIDAVPEGEALISGDDEHSILF